ncbi:hypothetical protein RYX36_032999, partial [Vicia faba]
GYGILTVQACYQQLRPIPCKDIAPIHMNQCKPAAGSQAAIIYTGLYLVALGTSGIKAAFFNWFLFSLTTGAMVDVTIIVWISTNQGWYWIFTVCTIAVLFSILSICMGKSLYRNNTPKGSPLIRIMQVFVAAFKNRKLQIPENEDEMHEIHEK